MPELKKTPTPNAEITPSPPASNPAKLVPARTETRKRSAPTMVTRRAVLGDTTGAKSSAGIGKRAVQASLDAAQVSQQSAILDILSHATDKSDALRTLLAGSSEDDIAALRQVLLGSQLNPNGASVFATILEETVKLKI